jgi:hypothetical protein
MTLLAAELPAIALLLSTTPQTKSDMPNRLC